MLMKKINSLLLVVDVQEKLAPLQHNADETIKNIQFIMGAANLLEIPSITTEQYPKGIGPTVLQLQPHSKDIHEKMTFSCAQDERILNAIKKTNRQQIIICGIETHICVLQTAIDLHEQGFKPYVIQDATSSRNINDKNIALARLQNIGISIVSKEMVVYEWLECSGTNEFKEINKMVKNAA
jgi:nicotinamidase-related amidase